MFTKTAIENRIRALNAIYDDDMVIVVKVLGVKLENNFYDFVEENSLAIEYGRVVEVVDTFGDKSSFTPLARTTAPAWSIIAFLKSLEAPVRDKSWKAEDFPMNENDVPAGYEQTLRENKAKGYALAKYEDGMLTFIKGESGKRAFSFSCNDYEKECVVTHYNLINANGEKIGELKEIIF